MRINFKLLRSSETSCSRLGALTLALALLLPPGANAQNAYITDYNYNGFVSVIDTTRNAIIATVPVGKGPNGVAVTPNGPKAYITNQIDGTVSVINTATNTITATIQTSNGGYRPNGIAVTPDGAKVYVTNSEDTDNTVSVIDTSTNTITATIPVGKIPIGVAVTPDGAKVYVTNQNSDSVSVIATATNTVVAGIRVGEFPVGVAVTPDGTKAYVTNYSDNTSTVSVIATASDTVTATIPVGIGPWGVAVTPDGAKAYVTNRASDTVSVIATASNTVVATIPVGNVPDGVAITPDGAKAYVANFNDNTVSVINTATNTVTATIPAGASPIAFGKFIGGLAHGSPPTITKVSPNPVTGSNSPQPFTIIGANFVSGANITLRDKTTGEIFPNRVASSFTATQIVINPIFTTAAHDWSVEVINPNGQSSGQFAFKVISPPNLRPIAKDPFVVPPINAGTSTTIDLSKGATGGKATSATIKSNPAHGTIVAKSGTLVTYAANACYTGPDGFTFILSNAYGPSNVATVNITVNPPAAPKIEVYLIDPYLLDIYRTNPANIDEASLRGVYSQPKFQAKGLVADGVSAAIAVVKTNSCAAGVTLKTTNGTSLLDYDPAFLTKAPASVPVLSGFSAADLQKNGGYGVALVQTPSGGASSSFSLTAQQGGQPTTLQAELVPPPVLLVHGIWADRTTFGGAGETNKLAYYLKTRQPWAAHPELVSVICYSNYVGFNAEKDSLTAGSSNSCEQTSRDAITGRIYGLLAYLDSLKIVGSRVDVVAHSMGGLAARNYASQNWYGLPPKPIPYVEATRIKSYRNRGQGQFHEIITLDTPELGSKLASSLIDHKDCHGRSVRVNPPDPIWGRPPGNPQGVVPTLWGYICGNRTVAECFNHIGLPLSADTAHPEDGAVYSLIPPQDKRGTAIKNLFGPNIPGADWRVIGAVKPGNGALGIFLNGLIKEVIPDTVPYCGPFENKDQTIDGILRDKDQGSHNIYPQYNDAIVTFPSQFGGTVLVDASHKWFPNLSHAPLLPSLLQKLLAFTKIEWIDDNVTESQNVWRQVCSWLSPSSSCRAEQSVSPAQPPVLHADELPVAAIPLVFPGTPNKPDPRNPTLRLQPHITQFIQPLQTSLRKYLPTNKVQFTIDPTSGSSFIKLDANGIIHPIKVGTAIVKAKYIDQQNPFLLPSQVEVNVVHPHQ